MLQKTTTSRFSFPRVNKIVLLALLIVVSFSSNVFSGPYHQQLGLKSVELGFDNFYRCGSYNPLRVTIHSGIDPLAGKVELELQDADGAKYRVQAGSISLASDSAKTIEVAVQVARKPCEIKISIRSNDDNKTIAQWNWIDPAPLDHALLSTQGLLLEIGSPVGLTRLAPSPKRSASNSSSEQKPLNTVSIASTEKLPSDVRSWESIFGAVLTLRLDDPKNYPNDQQCAAIEEWVRGGGQLLICTTSKTEKLEQSLSKSLLRLLPGELSEFVPVQSNIPWENFINSDLPIPGSIGTQRTYIPKWQDVRGKVLLDNDNDVPLIVETSLGLGKIVVASLSFTEPPISAWANNQKLLRKLCPWHWPSDDELANSFSTQSNRLGYNDLSGQLFVSMNRFPAATFPSFWMIIVGGVLIALSWYPLQAIWLNRLQSPTMRWGILIGVMSGLAFLCWKGTERDRAQPISLNSVEVVDVHLGNGRVQSHAWATFFSPNPEMTTTQFSVPAELLTHTSVDSKTHLGWLGLPGKGWGGIDSQSVTPISAEEPYDMTDQKLTNLVFPTGAVKAFRADWSHNFEPEKISPLIKKPAESHVSGRLKNSTGKTFNKTVLYYEKWALELGTLKPDQEVNLADYHSTIWSRESALVERRIDKAPYKPEAVDLRVIVNMMMMHRAAGSNRFTGLSNNVETHLDQSDALTANQAILIGWSDDATDWRVNALDQRVDASPNANLLDRDVSKEDPKLAAGEIAQKNVKKQSLTAYRFFLPVEVLKTNQTDTAGDNSGNANRNATQLKFPPHVFSTQNPEPKREKNP